eukprot:EG_transcript_31645
MVLTNGDAGGEVAVSALWSSVTQTSRWQLYRKDEAAAGVGQSSSWMRRCGQMQGFPLIRTWGLPSPFVLIRVRISGKPCRCLRLAPGLRHCPQAGDVWSFGQRVACTGAGGARGSCPARRVKQVC